MSCCLIAGCHRNRGLVGCLRKTRDISKAYELTKAAASSGYALAQLELGFMHKIGIGTPKDYNEAIKSFKAAKESADAELDWGNSDPKDTEVLKSVIRIADIQIKNLGL